MQSLRKQRGFWEFIVPAAASLLGGVLANRASASQAEDNRNFQADQSGTAHQRQVADLRAAGLNPILSATGGMGARSGAGAQAVQHDVITPAISSAYEGQKTKARVDLDRQLEKSERENERLKKNLADTAGMSGSLGVGAAPLIGSGVDAVKSAVGAAVTSVLEFISPGIPLPDQGKTSRFNLPAITDKLKRGSKTTADKIFELGSSSARRIRESAYGQYDYSTKTKPKSWAEPHVPPRGGYSSTDPR